MDGYWQITILILFSGAFCGFILGKKDRIARILSYSSLFYASLSAIRMLQGNAHVSLGEAFVGKEMMGYIKAMGVIIAVFIISFVLNKFFSDKFEPFLFKIAGYFICMQILTVTLWSIPVLWANVAQFAIAFVAAFFIKDNDKDKNNSYLMVIASVGAWITHYVLLGAAELYAFNKQEYMFTFADFYPYMLLFALGLMLLVFLAGKYLFDKKINTIISVLIWMYVIPSYIQTMFFNSGLNSMMETEETWTTSEIVINSAIWILIVAIMIVACLWGKSKGIFPKIVCYSSSIIVILQLLGLCSVIATKDVIKESKPFVTMDNMYSLSDDNIVIIMLDAYGTQVYDYVLERDENFFSPLHDFTYYNNMKSMHEFTDGAIHFLLTGKMKEVYSLEDNANSTFLKDIKKYGYDIRLYTVNYLATNFGDGVVSNISEEPAKIYGFKIVEQMISSGRYRSMPFIFKNYYTYSSLDFDKCINMANIYTWGTDAEVYWKLHNDGIVVDKSLGKTFSLYHLKGAHVNCYLRENMEYDYSKQDPLAQWRASMSIAYEFMDQMKAQGIYDSSTIIIMADHGPNEPTRNRLEQFDINFDGDLHPVFFIKRPGEVHDEMITNEEATTHEVFQGTIMELIDETNENYGSSLWD